MSDEDYEQRQRDERIVGGVATIIILAFLVWGLYAIYPWIFR